jgi:hypothetical protein
VCSNIIHIFFFYFDETLMSMIVGFVGNYGKNMR